MEPPTMPSLSEQKPAAKKHRKKPIRKEKSPIQRLQEACKRARNQYPGSRIVWSEQQQRAEFWKPDHTGEDQVVGAFYHTNCELHPTLASWTGTTNGIDVKDIPQLALGSEPQAQVVTNESSAVGLAADKEK
ncbi:hypothetical protein FOYG_16911 [Fusarium oxysporum NRRL 32931]|uniref:Uncharacterized protein n=1 Tax=Fusarium oxysporum NRRL 32931 TaxID=660029 RepID=W9HG81_FUSOX|nr:hypothetical protein FOYG_16911 [Fusarium oxysporum NRRL 32931]EWZ78385.1 hypothetical protein FOWG_17355 [Fusarium oxysporum f. sp. lycopersici MN25]